MRSATVRSQRQTYEVGEYRQSIAVAFTYSEQMSRPPQKPAAVPARPTPPVLAKHHATSTSRPLMNGTLRLWRQLAASAKLSSHVISKAAAPLLFETDRNLLGLLLSEPTLLPAPFAILDRLVAQIRHGLAVLRASRRLILVGAGPVHA